MGGGAEEGKGGGAGEEEGSGSGGVDSVLKSDSLVGGGRFSLVIYIFLSSYFGFSLFFFLGGLGTLWNGLWKHESGV